MWSSKGSRSSPSTRDRIMWRVYARPPGDMAKEIERKFLVLRHLLSEFTLGKPRSIVQGYLSAEPAVRVRTVTSVLGKKAFLTVKGPGTMERPEFEYEIPVSDAEEMMRLTRFRILKDRRAVLVGSHRWDVDFFTEERMGGLVLAEIELKSEDEEFRMPEWAGQEVTESPYYSNVSLAKVGAPPRTA